VAFLRELSEHHSEREPRFVEDNAAHYMSVL